VKLACTSAMTKADLVARSAAMKIPRTRSLSLVARIRMRAGLGVDQVPPKRRRDDHWTMRMMPLMSEEMEAVMMMTSNWSRSSRGERVDVAVHYGD